MSSTVSNLLSFQNNKLDLYPCKSELQVAQKRKNLQKQVRCIFEMNKDPNQIIDPQSNKTILNRVIELNENELMQELLKAGANPNTSTNFLNFSSLHYATVFNNPKSVQILLQYGANTNATDSEGNTPLHLATRQWNPAFVQILLQYGADPNTKNLLNQTVLTMATSNVGVNPEIISLLKTHTEDSIWQIVQQNM